MKLNSKEAGLITGVSITEQSRLAQRGLTRVTRGMNRNGGELHYDEVGILSLLVIRTLRKGGLEFDAIRPIAAFLNALTHDELDSASDAGLYIMHAPEIGTQLAQPTLEGLNRGPDSYAVHIPIRVFWERLKVFVDALERSAEAAA